jgi:hypothetical protein
LIVLSVAAAAACGVAFVRAALPDRGGWLIASAGLLAGLAMSGAAWSAGLLLFGAAGAGSDAVLLGLAALFFLLRPKRLPRGGPADMVPLALWAACGLAALVVTALFVEHSIRYPDGGWDATAIWNLRARSLFAAPDRLAEVFSPELGAQQPDYPPLLPGLIAHLWRGLGNHTPVVPIALSFLFAAGGALALGSAVSARRGPVLGVAAVLLLLGTPDLLILAWNQYADLKLAMLLLLAVVLATDRSFAAAGVLAGLGALTKNEGLLEAGTLGLSVLIVFGRRAALRFALGAAVPLALLLHFKLRWAPPNGLVAGTSARDVLLRAPRRIGLVARGFAAQLFDFAHWGCALAFATLCHAAGFRGRQRGSVAAVFVALTLPIFFGIYLATPWDPSQHIATSLDRLLFQLWPSIIFLTATSLFPAAAPAADAPPRSASDPA